MSIEAVVGEAPPPRARQELLRLLPRASRRHQGGGGRPGLERVIAAAEALRAVTPTSAKALYADHMPDDETADMLIEAVERWRRGDA
jgi:hypothetical protein